MKKNVFLSFLLLTVLSLVIVSCNTPPKTEPATVTTTTTTTTPSEPAPTPAPTPAPVPVINYSEKADDARKRAMDFNTQLYFPSDWETAENQYADAGKLPTSTDGDRSAKTAAFNSVADAYDGLFNKAVPLYAQAREDEIMDARNSITELVNIKDFPEYINVADNLALDALAKYEAGDFYKAKDSADSAMAEYDLLLAGAKAYNARLEIYERGFESYDADNLKQADDIADLALADYNDGKKADAKTKASDLELRYNLILKNSWVLYASDREKSATGERERAMANKVNIAMRESFREADAIYSQASDSYKAQNYPSAAILFTEAEARFAVAGRETEDKRQRAQDAIRLAENSITANEENAVRVEGLLDGGSR